MLRAEHKLDHPDHDRCTTWRQTLKPFLKRKLYPLLHEPLIPLVKRNNENGIVRFSVDDIFQAAVNKLSETVELGDANRATYIDYMDDEVDSEVASEYMDEEVDDEVYAFCCRDHLQKWRDNAIKELAEVQF